MVFNIVVGYAAGGGTVAEDALDLQRELAARGYSAFLSDGGGDLPGAGAGEGGAPRPVCTAGESVGGCRALVALCTEAYGESPGCRAQAGEAERLGKAVVAVLRSGQWPPAPGLLESNNYVRWRGAAGAAACVEWVLEMGTPPAGTSVKVMPPPLEDDAWRQEALSSLQQARVLAERKDPAAVVAHMRANIRDPSVVCAMCTILAKGAGNDWGYVRRAVHEAGAYTALAAAMQTHEESPRVQGAACKAAAALATTDIFRTGSIAGEAEVIAAAVVAMRAHVDNGGVQENVCGALWSMCNSSPDNRARAVGAGAVEAMVAAMRAHASNAGMQEQACGALRSMCNSTPDNRARAGGAGAVKAVVAAMRVHVGNGGVQEGACGALQNMCTDTPDNRARAVEAGAVEAVVAAMRAHAGNGAVQDNGCGALVELIAASPDNKARAVKAGVRGAAEAAGILGDGSQPLSGTAARLRECILGAPGGT